MQQISQYNTPLFKNLWEGATTTAQAANFLNEWKASPFYTSGYITDSNITFTFWLLFTKYANTAISGYTVDQWKLRLFNKIYDCTPMFVKKLDIQSKLRALTDDQLQQGAKTIRNNASNPAMTPTALSVTELSYINSQDTLNERLPKIEGYATLWNALEDNLSVGYLNNFDDLFLKVVIPQKLVYFEVEE